MKELFLLVINKLVEHPEKAKFLLAVSGGKDSSVLAHLFAESKLHFDMAHCNFHLRDQASDEDMAFVMKLSLEYHCGFLVKEFYHDDFEKIRGKSTEMIARELRYRWFEEIGKNYDFIVTAHHANDNAETLLLNLSKGTGLKGLTAIPEVNGKIIRPLLSFKSSDIENYIQKNNLFWQMDVTNLTTQYQRNKIRWNVIPPLEEINPSLISTMTQNIDIFKRQYNYYKERIEADKKKILQKKGKNFVIDIKTIENSPHVQLLLYEILSDFGFHFSTVHDIQNSLNGHSGKTFFAQNFILLKDRNQLIIKEKIKIKTKPLLIKNVKDAAKYGFQITSHQHFTPDKIENNNNVIYVDSHKIDFPLTVRYWQNGDYFFPFGMKGKKKLSDFFNDLKLDIFTKRDIPILCHQDKIIWVAGYRADNRYRVESEDYYRIEYAGDAQHL
jgi:tRNA(Ile)-lysidine synthase